jgi:hypothetical protein
MAFVRIRPLPGHLAKVADLARATPEVTECHRITGEDCFILKVYLKRDCGPGSRARQILGKRPNDHFDRPIFASAFTQCSAAKRQLIRASADHPIHPNGLWKSATSLTCCQ